MKTFTRTVRFELIKITSSRVWWVICALVVIVQPFLAYIVAKSYAQMGLDATPETHPGLAEALPPLDYIGLESVLFGLLSLVVLGGIIGASEFKHHELRTTLLCQSSRLRIFGAKTLALTLCTMLLSLITIWATISITHVGLGEEGLHPLYLSTIAWQYIFFAALNWGLLTILSFSIGMLLRNALVPLVFLVPQVYNLGNYLAEKWVWAEYLPAAAGHLLFATPTDPFEHDPLKGGMILLIWMMVTLGTSYITFIRSDVGGKY